MKEFAKVENGVVVDVIQATQEYINDLEDKEKYYETSINAIGGAYMNEDLTFDYTIPVIRKNHAGIGFTYNEELDAFIPPKIFESWLFDEEKCYWIPPVEKPEDGKIYRWNEENKNWEEMLNFFPE